MADSLDIFTGVLLTVIGLVLVYGSIVYRLIDLILLLGVLITIFGLYKLLSTFILRILDSRRGPRSKNRLNQKESKYSRVMEGAKEVENLINSKDDKKSKSKSVLGRQKDLKESSMTLDEYLSKTASEPKPVLDSPIDESKQVLKTKSDKEEKPKFKLPSIRKSSKPKKRSFGYLKEDQKESSPDTVYFTPNYEKPMKVTRKPKKKSGETINLADAPKRSNEISKALASVGETETVYDNEVSDESFSLMPKTMDEEIILPIDEISLDEIVEEPIYNLSQSENTLYNNEIYDDGVITPIYADEVYKEEHGISDEELNKAYEESYVALGLDEKPNEGVVSNMNEEPDELVASGFDEEPDELVASNIDEEPVEDDLDYITPEVGIDVESLPRPTSIASTNPIATKSEAANLARPVRKSEILAAPKPKAKAAVETSKPISQDAISRPAPRPKARDASDIPSASELMDTPDGTIQIDPNDPESIPIPKLLNSYVICDKGILTSQEAFEEVASHSKEEILLEAPTIKDMGDRFLSNLSKIKSRVIIEEFDLDDISYVLLLSSLIKKGVEIKTLASVDSFNLIGDTSHALIISNSIDEDDFEYGAVYDDVESVENIKQLFESSWKLANDLDISAIVDTE